MMIQTAPGVPIDGRMLSSYVGNLVNLFFKILPIRESEEPSLKTYMESLQAEVLGCEALIDAVHADPMFISLVSILQYLIDHSDSGVTVYRREVFKAISICNKLKARYTIADNGEEG